MKSTCLESQFGLQTDGKQVSHDCGVLPFLQLWTCGQICENGPWINTGCFKS